jgi:4-amino-4-deoxy-L-arabinose transferase-like glycosyltransferase
MPPPFWAKPRFVFSAILVYLAFHFAIRMAMGQALSVDDSDQALFSQFYAWAYRYKAPPLFVWLLATLGHVMPVNAVAVALLRYSLLGILYVFIYLAARRLLADPRLSALSVYSFAAINTFAESSHRNLAHTTALAALLAVAWYVFLRLAAAPLLGWYLVLGAVFGLGMLAKWNFVLFALALPLACLVSRQGRDLVLTWKIIPAGLVTAAIVAPTVVATLKIGPSYGESVTTVLQTGTGPGLEQIVAGTLKLLDTALVYSLNLLPIVLIVFGLPLWRGLRAHGTGGGQPRPFPDAALVGATIAIGLAFLWALVLFFGATEFKVRYLYPALLILPVWLFMVIERGRPSDRAISLFALVMTALVVIVGVKRLGTQFTRMLSCGLCTEMRPYGELAARLKDAGYQAGGTILASDTVPGNLRVPFPEARIIDPLYPRTRWSAPSGEGQCLLVWEIYDGDTPGAPAAHAFFLTEVLHGRLEAPYEEGTVSAPMLFPAEGEFSLGYRLYGEPTGDCR